MSNKPVYVLTAPYYKTGGTELCHQLVYTINKLGGEAYIAYTTEKNGKYLNPAFTKYVSDYKVITEDFYKKKDIVVVIPESETLQIEKFEYADVYLWWMSVDNYFKWQNIRIVYQEIGLLRSLRYLLRDYRLKKKYLPLSKMDMVKLHLAQSEYAVDFLRKNGFDNVCYLSDHINAGYIEKADEVKKKDKEDCVVYNPSKGWHFTKRIIMKNQDVKFVALQGMTNDQVMECMAKAKVYIDFGAHPGKDRMPREAALMKCCILTGRRGSANYNDVSIPEEYKINDSVWNLTIISQKIKYLLENYNSEIEKYDPYISKIKGERDEFKNDVRSIFL